MKDLADMARAFTEFKAMMQQEESEGSNPLAALADAVRILSSIYEELVKLNRNLTNINGIDNKAGAVPMKEVVTNANGT